MVREKNVNNGEFGEMRPEEFESFKLSKTTEEEKNEAVIRRTKDFVRKLREKDITMEEGFKEADRVIINEARMEALHQAAREEGKESVFKEFEEIHDHLPSLEGKIEVLQSEIQELEDQLKKTENTYIQAKNSENWVKKIMNRFVNDTKMEEKIKEVKEELSAKKIALGETKKVYGTLIDRKKELEIYLK